MKRLSIAVVLVAASVTFAKAQITDSAKIKTETAAVTPEMDMKADTSVVATPSTDQTKMDEMKAHDKAVKKETPAEMKRKSKADRKMEAENEK